MEGGEQAAGAAGDVEAAEVALAAAGEPGGDRRQRGVKVAL